MTRTMLLALILAVPAAAAPLPDAERERLAVAHTFGTWTDPTGENAFRADGSQVRVKLPGAPYRVGHDTPSPQVVPRFVRRVEGDFTAVVRVDLPALADGVVANDRALAAGLVATDAAGARIGIWRTERGEPGCRMQLGGGWTVPGKMAGGMGGSSTGGRAWVRLVRAGKAVRYGYRLDDGQWRDGEAHELGWAGAVEVGVFAENTTGVRAEVTFDRYSLTQPKK